MESIKPKTYNELMRYKRCLEFGKLFPKMNNELFDKIYHHMEASDKNNIDFADGKLTFFEGAQAMETIAIAVGTAITAIHFSALSLEIHRPATYSDTGDGGSSGNNNNNNNNNNNA